MSEKLGQLPQLGARLEDRWASILKAGTGAIPWVGSIIAEVVSNIIPNQRLDRIEQYLVYLTEELAQDGRAVSEVSLKDPENVALLEDGAFQAVRALSDTRRQQIARAVAEGMSDEKRRKVHSKRILALLAELDDEELLILDAYADRDGHKFENLMPEPAHLGSDRETLETELLYKAGVSKLERLELLKFDHKFDKKSGQFEYDAFGKRKGYYRVTLLGELLLKSIGPVGD